MTVFPELEISLHRYSAPDYLVEYRFIRPDSQAEERQLPDHAALARFEFDRLHSFEYEPDAYGQVLTESLFADQDVRDVFVHAVDVAESLGNPLRLRLAVGAKAEELHSLRWETLLHPTTHSPLCTNENVYFSRYLGSRGKPVRLHPQHPLRILAVAANPSTLSKYSLEKIDVEGEFRRIESVLVDTPPVIVPDPQHGGPATLDRLFDNLRESPDNKRFDVVYLVCHGVLVGEEGYLWFEDNDGLEDRISGAKLAQRMQELRELPTLFILASCDSAGADEGKALAAIGPRLVEVGVPAVVAMQGKFTMDTASRFMPAYFRELQRDGQFERAMVVARGVVRSRPDSWVPVLYSRMVGSSLFLDQVERDLEDNEIQNGLKRLQTALMQRAPVLTSEIDELAKVLNQTIGISKDILGKEAIKERTEALLRLDEICGEIIEISFYSLALGSPLPTYDDRCPFLGLNTFTPKERSFFFGRKALTETLRQKLIDHPFLAVLGSSGCGKSSVVLAGLLPLLAKDDPDLTMVYLKPGNNPSAELKAAKQNPERINPLFQPDQDNRYAQPKRSGQVVVVDQFEELFTLCRDEQRRQDFLNELLEIMQECPVVISMRADFWGECAPYSAIKEEMQNHQELVAPINTQDLGEVIADQAESVGLSFEDGLITTILDEVNGEPGAMPLVQYALLLLWERRHGRFLKASAYHSFGGVKKAIAFTADQFYEKELTDKYKELASRYQDQSREIFVRLTRPDEETGLGGERHDTRQRVALAELVPRGGNLEDIHQLVAQLADKRLVVTGRDRVTGIEQVEVAHEALIRAWDRLQGWLKQDQEAIQLRIRIRQQALDWNEHGRESDYLIRGKRLDECRELLNHPRLKLNQLESEYLDACQRAEQWPVQATLCFRAIESPVLDIYLSQITEEPSLPVRSGDEVIKINFTIDPLALAQSEQDGSAYGRLLGGWFLSSPETVSFLTDGTQKDFSKPRAYLEQYFKDETRAEPWRDIRTLPLRVQFRIDPEVNDFHRIAWHAMDIPPEVLNNREMIPTMRLKSRRVRSRGFTSMRALLVGIAPAGEQSMLAERLQLWRTIFSQLPCEVVPLAPGQTDEGLYTHLLEGSDLLYLTGQMEHDKVLGLGEDTQMGKRLFDALRFTSCPPRLVILEMPPARVGVLQARDTERMTLALVAQKFILHGVPAVVGLPADLPAETLKVLFGTFIEQLQQHGEVDRALRASRQATFQKAGSWQVLLYTASDDGKIGYLPGFSGHDPKKMSLLGRGILSHKITPILGPGLSEAMFGSQEDLARRMAVDSGYALSSNEEINPSSLFQTIATRVGESVLKDSWFSALREETLQRYSAGLPEELVQEIKRNGDGFLNWIKTVFTSQLSTGSGEVYQKLAELRLPIYITGSPTTTKLIAEALLANQSPPDVCICPWNDHIENERTYYQGEPTPEKPLVYALLGSLGVPDSLVLTENDYFDFLIGISRNRDFIPTCVRAAMASTSLLFLGFQVYSRDYQTLLRSILSNPGSESLQRYQHAIQIEPNLADYHTQKERYEQEMLVIGGTNSIYWGSTQEFIQELNAAITHSGVTEK